MIPIGILTKDRVGYLQATLTSLRASDLPEGIPITIYDDDSTDPDTRRYLDTTDTFQIKHRWPTATAWQAAGLGFLPDNPTVTGLGGGTVNVGPSKVTAASCRAICHLFDAHPKAPAIILLQDDVVFDAGWYQKITSRLTVGEKLGMVAGMHIDKGMTKYCTAQCCMITREVFELCRSWMESAHEMHKCFDVQLCRKIGQQRYKIVVMDPYVCQHTGAESIIRPGAPLRLGSKSPASFAYTSEAVPNEPRQVAQTGIDPAMVRRVAALEKEAKALRAMIGQGSYQVHEICSECDQYSKCKGGTCKTSKQPVSKLDFCPAYKWIRV